MSEPIRTLWFESVSFFNEPMLDTPIGRFSIRQTIALLAFGLLGWLTSFFFEDLMFKIVFGATVFLIGAFTFTRRVKTVPPERHLLLLLGIGRPLKKKVKKKGGRKSHVKPIPPAKSMAVSTTLNAPVKVVGVLRDPASGKLLPHRGFETYVDKKPYSAGVTDEHGFFSVRFIPERYGVFEVEVKPEGFADVSQRIKINVKPEAVKVV